MLKQEFVDRFTGLPWANRACSFDAVDCWGLVVMYYRHVLGQEIHHSPDYEAGSDFHTCFADEVLFWKSTDIFQEDGIFVSWYGSHPAHVGLIVNGEAFHSRCEGGHVRSDPVRTIQRLFTKVEFFTYANYRDSTGSRAAEGASAGADRETVPRVA